MQNRLKELSEKIDALTRGLGEAQKLLGNLTSQASQDPKQALLDEISTSLADLGQSELQSTADFVAFLASRPVRTAGGTGGGENQPPTSEDDP